MSNPQKSPEPVIRAEGLAKAYPAYTASSQPDQRASGEKTSGERAILELELFRDVSFAVLPGEMVAIVGQSGAGKSSLLHLLAALDRPSAGEIWVGEHHVNRLSERQASEFRNRHIGYVWQFHYLMPEFTALENVAMPLLARGLDPHAALARAALWLDEVGLAARASHRSGELSGGEQQRVSVARALVTEPRVLLADEPTGDLDGRTAETVFSLIAGLHQRHELTTVFVTHNLEFAGRANRTLTLRDGSLCAPPRIA